MIITKKYAMRLVRLGKAQIVGSVIWGGISFTILNRYDLGRTDHF